MATFTKKLLSGSTNGKQIKLTANANPGQLIHTATNVAGQFDEIWIYCYNEFANTVLLTILWGGVTEPDNVIRVPIPSQAGRVLCIDGMLLNGGLVVNAYGSVTADLIIDGFVNNIAP